MKQCPFCKEMKDETAGTCPHCGKEETGKGMLLLILFFGSPALCCFGLVVMSAISSLFN